MREICAYALNNLGKDLGMEVRVQEPRRAKTTEKTV